MYSSHPDPVKELRRLLTLHRAYVQMRAGEGEAAMAAAPGNLEIAFWHALRLVGQGNEDQALPIFRRIFAADPNWKDLVRRLPAAGLIDEEQARRIVE